MPERSTISQGIQIGVETTEGTVAPANKKLSSLSIMPKPNMEFSTFGPMGNKFDTLVTLNREWSTADLEGRPTFTEIVYPLSSIMGAAAITTPATAVNGRQWEFAISPTAADPGVSFTVETGDGTLAERVAGLVVNSLTIGFSRTDDPELSGDAFARAFTTGATLTATPTEVALIPILPAQVSVYVDAPGATPETALGTTKLTRVQDVSFSISDRFSQFWALDAAQNSYVATLEGKPGATIEFSVMADAAGMAFINNARAGDTRMIRIQAVSTQLVDAGIAATAYRFTIDAAVKISEVGDRDDNDGALVVPYTGTIVYDPTWGRAVRLQVVNGLAAL
ncbi:MAG: hypothetical protein M3440_09545 [Chloroflexota bacterium]|nr:hypothetical protein [Chloroflexota bacterium]